MEIKLEIPFNPEQVSMLDMHSVLNVLNVVQYELLNLSTELDDPDELMGLIQATAAAGLELSHPERALEHVRAASDFAVQVNTVLDGLEEKLNLGQDQGFQATRRNLNGIFTVLKVRAQEIIDRTDNPGKWVTYGLEKLKFNFEQVLHSIEKNSKGAYGIVYNIAQHHEGDYLVHLDFLIRLTARR